MRQLLVKSGAIKLEDQQFVTLTLTGDWWIND